MENKKDEMLLEEFFVKPVIFSMSGKYSRENFSDPGDLAIELKKLFLNSVFQQLCCNAAFEMAEKIAAGEKLDGFNDWVFDLRIGVVKIK